MRQHARAAVFMLSQHFVELPTSVVDTSWLAISYVPTFGQKVLSSAGIPPFGHFAHTCFQLLTTTNPQTTSFLESLSSECLFACGRNFFRDTAAAMNGKDQFCAPFFSHFASFENGTAHICRSRLSSSCTPTRLTSAVRLLPLIGIPSDRPPT